jgi:hypothetical protein
MRLVEVKNPGLTDLPPVNPVPDGRKSKGSGASGLVGVPTRGTSKAPN